MSVINFVLLRIHSSLPILTQECDYWLDCPLPILTLLFLPQVTSISSLPFSSLPNSVNLSGYSGLWRTQGNDYWLDLSLSFWLPIFSSWSPLSPSPLFSSLRSSVNLSGCSRLWRAHRELITGKTPLSPFDSPSSPPGHLYLPPLSSLVHVILWTSMGVPHYGEAFLH